jgi:hypothetical protein
MRVNTVRNHWLTKTGLDESGYIDHSLWEKSKLRGEVALKKLIDEGLAGSSVTAILIGKETAGRKWVDYEIKESHRRGNGIIGVYINKIKSTDGTTDPRGLNPLENWTTTKNGVKVPFTSIYSTYDWVDDDGFNDFGKWVEAAAKAKGK